MCTYRAPLTQSVEYWSYEPKVAGSSPAWSSEWYLLHSFYVVIGAVVVRAFNSVRDGRW